MTDDVIVHVLKKEKEMLLHLLMLVCPRLLLG